MIITAGQDANWLDPLAQMMVTMDGFRQMSELMVNLAEEVCEGRLVMLQAGGYSTAYVPYCTVAAVEPLLGVDIGLVDLYASSWELERCRVCLRGRRGGRLRRRGGGIACGGRFEQYIFL